MSVENRVKNQEVSSPLIDVALYLRGCAIDPLLVSSLLGVEPTKSRIKDQKWQTRTGHQVIAKTGFWELTAQSVSEDIADQISWLRHKLSATKCLPIDIPGVEEIELSIFVALGSDAEGVTDYNSRITAEDLAWLDSLGCTVTFSITYVKD